MCGDFGCLLEMGNPVKEYCYVYINCSAMPFDYTTFNDAETGEVLDRTRGALNYDDERLRDLAEEWTGKTCLKVIRE